MTQTHREQDTGKINRRTFVKAGAATALTAASWARVSGANDRIGIGMIGIGLMGRIHTRNFAQQPDVNMVGICDVYDPRARVGAEICGGNVVQCRDFRKLLDNKDIDAVVISTSDHWHALMTMMACAAGKDVYVEKPLTLFVREGRWMIDVAQRHKRVVQVGVQNRSGPNFQRARQFIQDGNLGQIVAVQDTFCRNLMPGFGNPPDQEPPKELDWDLWVGPAPARAYNPNRGIYHFRWIWDYAGGQMTNLGQHSLDIVQWFTGAKAPKSVYSTGGRTYLKDNMETPDSQDVLIDYPGFTGICVYREATTGRAGLGMGGVAFYGTRGMMTVGRGGYEVVPDRKVLPMNTMANILGGHPPGGPQMTPEPENQLWTERLKDDTGNAAQDYVAHARNFLDCIRSRQQPLADIVSAHEVATTCHLANISLLTGRKITWDAEKEQIVGDPKANAMLTRPYRQ
ncbi:MAG: Gfo/Idh/MocA family oxidoreductase, partial [Planctomycetes bacterium]|nr:Gfo/Idh/MocA family oxidoreductase [Planctomycetota bacterium]